MLWNLLRGRKEWYFHPKDVLLTTPEPIFSHQSICITEKLGLVAFVDLISHFLFIITLFVLVFIVITFGVKYKKDT